VQQVYPDLEEIVRVDVDLDGGTLMLTAVGAAGTRWFTHDGQGLLERFPESDPKLPLSAHLGASGEWRVLSYRPGRRVVVAAQRGEPVVLKGHRRSRSSRAAAKQGLAERAMQRGAFRVPRLLRHDGEHEALVFERLTGKEVELERASVPLYRRLGEELAVFQRDGAAELETFTPVDELGVLELWRRKVERAELAPPAGWPEAHARLVEFLPRLPATQFGLAHRDLHDRQVHLVGGQVALFDFDLLCRADVALDPGNLVAHLCWRAHQGLHGADESSARELESALLAGLGREGEPGFETRLAFYSASALLRLALVYRLRPRWSARVTELVARAGAVLDDLAPTG